MARSQNLTGRSRARNCFSSAPKLSVLQNIENVASGVKNNTRFVVKPEAGISNALFYVFLNKSVGVNENLGGSRGTRGGGGVKPLLRQIEHWL